MNNTLIDNSTEQLSMQTALNQCLSQDCFHTVSIATGYWDMPGLALIVDQLEVFLKKDGTKLRLLIGKDPYVFASQLEKPKVKSPQFPDDYIKTDINELELKDEYKHTIQFLLENCTEEDSKVEIRVYRTDEKADAQFLHSKCYIFTGKNDAVGIVGSSNFTAKGLEGNAELNYMETDWMRVAVPETNNPNQKSHIMWFEEKWQISQHWNRIFLEQILRPSPIATKVKKELEELSPYEVYIKYLQLQFGDVTDESVTAQLKSYLPKAFNPYSYQLDAVKQCFYIMKAHGGFFLSDVVGLGKTIIGVLVIKKFIAEADLWNRHPKVLIVTPPAIKKSWLKTIAQFDKDDDTFKIASNIEFITTGSIGSLITDDGSGEDDDDFDEDVKSSDYGLILIDESHNFRNNWTQKYATLDNLIDRIQLQTGYQPLIGLLSATPQNNSPQDLKNQIYFFQRSHNSTTLPDIPGGKLDSYFNEKQKLFNDNRNVDTPEAREIIKGIAADIHDKVLQYLMVRRTRKDIKEQYAEDSKQLKFPSVKGPIAEHYTMSAKLSKLFYDTVFAIVGEEDDDEKSIGYYRYAAISYLVKEEDKKLFEKRNLKVEGITSRLAKIMKLLLVKRLESSFPAFQRSLENLRRNTQNMIDMLNADTVFICPDIDVNEIIAKEGGLDNAIPVLRKRIEKKGGKNREFRSNDLKKDEYLRLLEQDMELIDKLCKRWEKNTEDPKFEKFKAILDTELYNPEINNPHHFDKPRLVIFTEALDTMQALAEYVKSDGHRPLVISAKNRDELQGEIAANFDANQPKEEQRDDYDVIITTEVLAEGVNLHRANVILNYDAPWNATRLMQRIGRVNRIGSKEDFVHVFNFYPSDDGEKIIKYLPKAYAKLQAFHTMFGEDNKVFSEMEELSEADLNNMVDGDTSPFAPFINELKRFAKEYPERYQLICNTEARQLGGFRVMGLNQDLFYVGAENHQFVHILIDKDNNPQIVSPLRFIQAFQMTDDKNPAFGKADIKKYEEKASLAINTFNAFITQSKKAKDARKIMQSMAQWKFILDQLTDKEAKAAMKNVRKAIENQNTIAIKLTKQLYDELNQGEQSLFGLDADVNDYVKATFAHISNVVKQKYGEPYVSIYQISNEE